MAPSGKGDAAAVGTKRPADAAAGAPAQAAAPPAAKQTKLVLPMPPGFVRTVAGGIVPGPPPPPGAHNVARPPHPPLAPRPPHQVLFAAPHPGMALFGPGAGSFGVPPQVLAQCPPGFFPVGPLPGPPPGHHIAIPAGAMLPPAVRPAPPAACRPVPAPAAPPKGAKPAPPAPEKPAAAAAPTAAAPPAPPQPPPEGAEEGGAPAVKAEEAKAEAAARPKAAGVASAPPLEGAGASYGRLAALPREALVQKHLLSVSRLANVTADNEALQARAVELQREHAALAATATFGRADDAAAGGAAGGGGDGGAHFERLLSMEPLAVSEIVSRHMHTLEALRAAEKENEELTRSVARLEEANASFDHLLGPDELEELEAGVPEDPTASLGAAAQWVTAAAAVPAGMPRTVKQAYELPADKAAVLVGPDARTVVHVSDAWVEMCGFTREEAVGSTLRIIQGAETDKACLKLIGAAIAEGCYVEASLVNFAKGHKRFRNRLSVAPVLDTSTGQRCYLGVLSCAGGRKD